MKSVVATVLPTASSGAVPAKGLTIIAVRHRAPTSDFAKVGTGCRVGAMAVTTRFR